MLKKLKSKKRYAKSNYEWSINNIKIEEVNEFVYLGLKFSKTGKLIEGVKTLSCQALKAMNNVFCFLW